MYKMFIDESGKNTLKGLDVTNPFFAMSGVIAHKNSKEFIENRANQIKFKYWGDTSIVFHANDLKRKTGVFDIFSNSTKFTLDEFYIDFLKFIQSSNFKLCWIGMNKSKYIDANPPVAHALKHMNRTGPSNNWNKVIAGVEKNIVKNFTFELLTTYLCYLRKSEDRGQVLIEAADEYQDLDIFAAYNKLMISGHTILGMSTTAIRESLTSISFVTKKNLDIETQLADMAAYYLNLDERAKDGLCTIIPNSYEQKLIDIFKTKLFKYKDKESGHTGDSFLRKI